MWSTEALASGASTSSPSRSSARPNGTPKAPSTAAMATTSRTNGADPESTVWTYDATAFDAVTGNATTSTGPKPSKSRLLWSRLAPEEEEREEEALPSYLTYLQPALTRTSSRSSSDQGRWEDAALAPSLSPNAAPFVQSTTGTGATTSSEMTKTSLPVLSVGAFARNEMTTAATSNGSVQAKAKEFAWALQEFVQQQVEQQQQQRNNNASGFATNNGSSCACGSCDEWKTRVSDLEQQVQLLQQQVGALVNGSTGGQATTSALRVNVTASSMHMPLVQPPPPPMPPPMPHSNGSPPLAPPPLGGSSSSIHSGLNDRISTLEGRQSAFQSQLAHISKVLGIPAGKHGKNSQLKTLVQTLHDEVDAKTAVAAQEMGARCRQALAQELVQNVERTVRAQLDMQFGTNAASPLSHDVILGALAEEHEASLARLNASVDERLAQENKRRTALENRVSRRLTEQEEWLQQLEGEFGSWHDMSSSVDAQLRDLQRKLGAMEEKWNVAQQSSLQQFPSDQEVKSGVPEASGEKKSSTSGGVAGGGRKPSEAEVAALHSLQAQLKQFQLEYKNELAALKDELALVDACGKTTRQESRDFATRLQALKQMVERLVRESGNVEEVVQRSVRTITEQVASVTRDFVGVRIQENNRLIDATLRARVPAYVEHEADRHQLVPPKRSVGSHATDEDEAGAEDGGGMAWYGMPWNELAVQPSGGGKDPMAPMRVVVPGGSSATNSP